MPRTVALILLAACGRLGFDAQGRTQTDAPADGVSGDAVLPDAPSCVGFGAWSAPVPLTELNSPVEDIGPAISPDGLTIYFHSVRPGGAGSADIYEATRTMPSGPFGAPSRITVLNTSGFDRDPTIARGGTRVYFNRNGGPLDRIYYSDRVGNMFTAPVLVPELDGGYGPWVADDELEAIVSRGGGLDLATRASATQTWNDDGPLTTLNSPQDDGWPSIGANDRQLVFESDRSGTSQIVTAQRAARGQPFGAVTPVVELNTMGGQADPYLSADGRTIYFASNRNGGQNDLYVATRPCN